MSTKGRLTDIFSDACIIRINVRKFIPQDT